MAKRPRHQDLDLSILGDESSAQKLMSLTADFEEHEVKKRSLAGSEKGESQLEELRAHFANMKIVSQAKVTEERVYCSLYHPEKVRFFLPLGIDGLSHSTLCN